MNENVQEIGYYLLQNEYLKRLSSSKNMTIEKMTNSYDCFPVEWFDYSYERRIEILQQALRNNQTIDEIMYDNSKIK